jgi:cation transport regulator ChaC
MKEDLVFQYGSNMSKARFQHESRIPEAEAVGTAWSVDRYDFWFPVWSRQRGGRAASGIIPNPNGRRIFGVVYRIPDDLIYRDRVRAERRSLDEIEGEGINYYRERIDVESLRTGKVCSAITYLPISQERQSPTDEEYAGFIRDGLAEWNAPSEYVAYLEPIIVEALKR